MHAALGEPLRLAILDRLVLGDTSPSEIGQDPGEDGRPQALVARVLTSQADGPELEPGPLSIDAARRRPHQRIVTAMVAWSQLGILGYLVGPAVGGVLAEHLGYAAPGPLPAATGLALAALAQPRRHRHGIDTPS